MKILSYILVLLVAILHIYFLVLEMLLCNRPIGYKTQNLCNHARLCRHQCHISHEPGTLQWISAVGLIFSLVKKNFISKVFFLCCVIVAEIFGAVTAMISILYYASHTSIFGFGLCFTGKKTSKQLIRLNQAAIDIDYLSSNI